MGIQISVLGSGSGGNSTLLCFPGEKRNRYVLIDAGFSPREIRKRLDRLEVDPVDIEAILITHLHTDHFKETWLSKCEHFSIDIYLHQRHVESWVERGRSMKMVQVFEGDFSLFPDVSVQTMVLPHDQMGSIGFLFEHQSCRLGYLTDLGTVPRGVYDKLRGLDALAIESNYDTHLQANSRRPAVLKKRIMGQKGHLSNVQSWEAVQQILQQCALNQIIFLHLSRQCNAPRIIEELYAKRSPQLLPKLRYTDQFVPTPFLEIEAQARNALQQPVERAQMKLL